MSKVLKKLKERWGISSSFQVVMILLVFTATGYSTLYVHGLIDQLLGITKEAPFFLKFIVFIILILPLYALLLYIWGYLLGQSAFFSKFLTLKFNLLFGRFRNKGK